MNAVYDLASHDVSIFNWLLGSPPLTVSAVGEAFLQDGIEDIAFISLRYPNDVLARIHASWLDPKKVREITIVGARKMITWDDLSPLGTVQVFDKSVVRDTYYADYGHFQLLAREGDITIPRIPLEEPLKKQAPLFPERHQERAGRVVRWGERRGGRPHARSDSGVPRGSRRARRSAMTEDPV